MELFVFVGVVILCVVIGSILAFAELHLAQRRLDLVETPQAEWDPEWDSDDECNCLQLQDHPEDIFFLGSCPVHGSTKKPVNLPKAGGDVPLPEGVLGAATGCFIREKEEAP